MDSFEAAGGRFDLGAADLVIARVLGTPTALPVLTGSGDDLPRLALVLRSQGEQVHVEGRVTVRQPGFDGPLHQFMVGTDYVAPVFEALGRLFENESRGEKLSADGVEATAVTGRPMLDGRVTDRLLTTLPRGELDARRLEAVLRLLVVLGSRRLATAEAGTYLRGRSFRLDPKAAAAGPGPSWPSFSRNSPATRTPLDNDVRLADLGGLEDVVSQLRDVADSFRHPEVMARWGARRPQGILMWGPPGTGKTTLARALANEIGGTLKEVRSNDILDRWMGASERNIAQVFAEARGYTEPTVLLFDEFDSIVSYAGRPQGSADQAINSVAGIFKQEMNDLIEANPNVIVVATTNFPDRVDESLIRSGRFDVKLAVPLPGDAARADILAKLLKALEGKHSTDAFRLFADDVSVTELAHLSAGLSGADLAEVLRRAQLEKAMTEARGGQAGPITQADLELAIMKLDGART
ncbi:ATP-binding protein [Kineosporia rhizophila]|uniref:ATP-binding protein n=1 Tax=Kineosporia rhizophila TaxID=84633 RepID=UPI001E5B83F7|nr:ATP-binding protein [Kineosporia rhizophila]MCE0537872.1 ATP-binding protein [Kineosporia rhizophila]